MNTSHPPIDHAAVSVGVPTLSSRRRPVGSSLAFDARSSTTRCVVSLGDGLVAIATIEPMYRARSRDPFGGAVLE